MANTVIKFRRSAVTAAPTAGSLNIAEPAYSFASDKLYMGNAAGTGVLTIGGKYYVDIVDGATSANNANNLVKRTNDGDFSGRIITGTQHVGALHGPANTANTLTTGRYIALAGDATANVIFDGSTNITLTVDLTDTGVTPGLYGATDGSAYSSFLVDIEGRITSASNVAIAAGSTFTVKGNTGSDVIAAGDNLNILGGDGITTAVIANTGNTIVQTSVDSTVVRTTGTQTIGGNKTFTGDIVMSGTTFFANTNQLNIGDNMLVLNADIPIGIAPSEDSGLVVNRGNTNSNAAIYWDETNDWWTAQSNNILSGASALGRLHTDGYANATALSVGTIPSARVSGSYTGITGLGTLTIGTWQASTINVQFGGTGQSSFALNGVIYGAGANGALLITTAPTEGKVLQGNVSGAPVFADLDGGTF